MIEIGIIRLYKCRVSEMLTGFDLATVSAMVRFENKNIIEVLLFAVKTFHFQTAK